MGSLAPVCRPFALVYGSLWLDAGVCEVLPVLIHSHECHPPPPTCFAFMPPPPPAHSPPPTSARQLLRNPICKSLRPRIRVRNCFFFLPTLRSVAWQLTPHPVHAHGHTQLQSMGPRSSSTRDHAHPSECWFFRATQGLRCGVGCCSRFSIELRACNLHAVEVLTRVFAHVH